MIDSILLGIELTSLFYLLWFVIKKPYDSDVVFIFILCIGIASIITILMYNVLYESESKNKIIVTVFSIQILFLLYFVKKRKVEGGKIVLITFPIILLLSILILKANVVDPKLKNIKFTELMNIKTKQKSIYLNRFNFNLDSVGRLLFNLSESQTINKFIQPPTIIYSKSDTAIFFNYNLNLKLSKENKTFSIDSVKVYTLISSTEKEVGIYSNRKTAAYREYMTIKFIDPKTLKLISSIEIAGENPPESIKYRRSAPVKYSGNGPSIDRIMEVINEELKLKH
jgi:hypothetical protein